MDNNRKLKFLAYIIGCVLLVGSVTGTYFLGSYFQFVDYRSTYADKYNMTTGCPLNETCIIKLKCHEPFHKICITGGIFSIIAIICLYIICMICMMLLKQFLNKKKDTNELDSIELPTITANKIPADHDKPTDNSDKDTTTTTTSETIINLSNADSTSSVDMIILSETVVNDKIANTSCS